MIDCVIFDCDGTLVDSEHLNTQGICLKLSEYNINLPASSLSQRFHGKKLELIINELEREYKIDLGDTFVSEYRLLVNDLFEQHLRECEGVSSMLKKLAKPKCIASGAPLQKIQKALDVTGLSDFFETNIYSSHEINSWKPDPDIFLYAAKNMGTLPERCAVVEDSLVGIQAAKNAKMKTIFYDPENIYTDMQGVHIIRAMHEVIAVVA